MMNMLARQAISEGADWIVFLDADESILVESRSDFEANLKGFGNDVMLMPWVNLIPESYGDFTSFDPEQKFYWRGDVKFCQTCCFRPLFPCSS